MASQSASSSGLSSPKSVSTPSAWGSPSPQASSNEATSTAPNNGSQPPVSEAFDLEIDADLAEQSADMEMGSWNAWNPPVPSPGPVTWEPKSSDDEALSAALNASNADMDDLFDLPMAVTVPDSAISGVHHNDSHLIPEIPYSRALPSNQSTQGEDRSMLGTHDETESFVNPAHIGLLGHDNTAPQADPNAGIVVSFQELRNRRADQFVRLAETRNILIVEMMFGVEDMREDMEELKKMAAKVSPTTVPNCFEARCQSISTALDAMEVSLQEKKELGITRPNGERCMCLFIGLALARLTLVPTIETDEASNRSKVRAGEINHALTYGSTLPGPYSRLNVIDLLHRMWQSLYTYHGSCQCEQCNVSRQAGR